MLRADLNKLPPDWKPAVPMDYGIKWKHALSHKLVELLNGF